MVLLSPLSTFLGLHRRFTVTIVVPPGYGLASIILLGGPGTPEYVTTIGLDITAAGTTFIDAADNVLASYIDAFQGLTADNVRIERVSLYVGSATSPGSVDSLGDGADGLRDELMAPIAMAPIVRKVTATLGRSGRGRMFLPGVLADADVDQGGNIESGSLGVFQDAVEQFFTNLLTADPAMELIPVLLHSEDSPSTTPTPIQGLQVAPKVGWIRGRIR